MDTSKPLAVFTVVDTNENKKGNAHPPQHGQSSERKKGYWCRIGTAFENKDGSLNVLLNALPQNGRLNIREDDRQRGDAIDAA